MRVFVLFIALFLSACAHQPRDLGYLEMPEEYLGYWQYAHGVGVNYGMMFYDNGIIHGVGHYDNVLQEVYHYKIFHIEAPYIYMIARSKYDDNFWHGDKKPEKPWRTHWDYYKIEYIYDDWIDPDDYDNETLFISEYYCGDLSDQDFNLPASVHWERFQRGHCFTAGDLEHTSSFAVTREIIPADDQSAPAPR